MITTEQPSLCLPYFFIFSYISISCLSLFSPSKQTTIVKNTDNTSTLIFFLQLLSNSQTVEQQRLTSASFCLATLGMTGNYLLTNPLLRPQGTNNPYNTLLAETVVCNSPTAPVFISPGVLTWHVPYMQTSLSLSLSLSLFLSLSLSFSLFLSLSPTSASVCFHMNLHTRQNYF